MVNVPANASDEARGGAKSGVPIEVGSGIGIVSAKPCQCNAEEDNSRQHKVCPIHYYENL